MIKASFSAGIFEILLGIMSYLTGFGSIYMEKAGMFGFLGVGLCLYAIFHKLFMYIDGVDKHGKKSKP